MLSPNENENDKQDPTMDNQPVAVAPSPSPSPSGSNGPVVNQSGSFRGTRLARGISRTGRVAIGTMLLALLFGIIVFAAGWEFGHGSAAASAAGSSVGALQPGNQPSTTIPPLASNNTQAVREAVIAKVSPAVVQVDVKTAQGSAIGSGVIIDRRGYIVTNNHVVNGAQAIRVVLYGGKSNGIPAQLVGTDPLDDLAVLKITPPPYMTVAALGNSAQLVVGEDVLAIGNPLGITQTVTNGIVSALNRTVMEGQGSNASIPDAIQTDAPINPGNSGGALVDMQGKVIGIPTLTAIDPAFNTPANGVGFAIPSNRVSFIVPQIISTGHVVNTGRAALGISAVSVTAFLSQQDGLAVNHGALIVNVQANGPAAHAGLQTGDVIVQVGSTAVDSLSSLQDVLAPLSPGKTVSVSVYRGNQQLTVNVTLGQLQAG